MEPQATRLRAATTWAGGAAALHERAALNFAEKRQYRELLHAVQLRPELASKCDTFAMTPLHWLCTDRAVPLRVLQQIVLAYPTATTLRNLAGLLPLHMAVQKDLPLDALKTVLKFYPKAVAAETPDGKTALQAAHEHLTSRSAKQFLVQLDQEVRSLGRVPASQSNTVTSTSSDTTASSSGRLHRVDSMAASNKTGTTSKTCEVIRGWEDGYPVAILDATPSPSDSHHSANERSPEGGGVGTRPLPPVWKLSMCCHVCESKFGYFKSRHHCRNCGESVCGRHSKHSVPLKHLGLFHPQRVCSGCFGRLQSHYTSRAIARLSPKSEPSDRKRDEVMRGEVMREDTLPMEYAQSPRRQRQTRSHSVQHMTASQEVAHRHPRVSPQHFQMRSPSPVITTPPPPPTRSSRSATLSPRSCRTVSASSTNTARSDASNATSATTSSAYKPNFIKMPSGMSMHIERVQRADEQRTVLERQREMQRRCDRLANTDIETYSKTSPRDWRGRGSENSSMLNNQSSNDDHELQLEMQMQKLLIAKKQISDALKRSKRVADHAQAEKDKYDGIAKAFEQRGYSYSSESPRDSGHVANGKRGRSEWDADAEQSESILSPTAAKYGYKLSEVDNQCDHEAGEDRNGSAVYGLVPETTPGELVRTGSSLFEKDTLDIPLNLAATYRELGVVMLSKGDFSSAAVELQKSLDVDQTNAQTWYYLAKAFDGKGESEFAESAIQRSLAIEPNSLPSLSLLGKLLNARGEHDEAIVVFRRALNLQCPSESQPVPVF